MFRYVGFFTFLFLLATTAPLMLGVPLGETWLDILLVAFMAVGLLWLVDAVYDDKERKER